MKKTLLAIIALSSTVLIGTGCSTTGQFKIPPNTTLRVTNRTAAPDATGKWKTSPFFWNETSGARYTLVDGNGTVLRSGKLKTHFRVVSIFWPPAAIIYWPMGFASGEFDLTKPGDGYMVVDDPGATHTATASAAPEGKKKKQKKSE